MDEQNLYLLNHHLSAFLADRAGLAGAQRDRLRQLVMMLTGSLEAGHSCLPLTADEADFLERLPLVSDGRQTPLVVCKNKLYLHRYYRYETRLARQIKAMAEVSLPAEGREALLDSCFVSSGEATDYQREAAKMALEKTLTVISGGPGTGKTTTVVKILALLFMAADHNLTAAITAPTGKAANRLSEAIGSSLARMVLSEEISGKIPTQATTLHRLLGVRQHSAKFKHDHENPLNWDVVIVDEASMVDLAMMSKLVDALKPGARLLLLGDKDQLASVESGAVLADFIKSLPGNTIELQKTFRFDDNIKKLAESINVGDMDRAWSLLQDAQPDNISVLHPDIIDYAGRLYGRFMQVVHSRPDPDVREIFSAFKRFQVLCGVHYGARGVEGINRGVELSLARQGFECRPDSWYPGRPVLVTRNDYSLDLFNGDIGICLFDTATKTAVVWFEGADGSLKNYSPYRLPPCETVFAMTIHKSQGSEFDEVVVVLPDQDNRILSRELIYTAVTRARKTVKIVAERSVFALALARNIVRHSGLAELLREEENN